MLNTEALQRDLATKKAEATALLKTTAEKAQADNRLMTDEERNAIKAATEEVHKLQAKIAQATGDQEMIAELDRLTKQAATPAAGSATARPRLRSLGTQFVESPEYNFFKEGKHRSQSAWRSPSVELFAATLTEDPASGGTLVLPQYLPGILPLPQRPLVVADLFAPGTTTSNAISYMVEKTFTNAAAPVLEGGVKPESTLVFEARTDNVRKIAHWLPVTEEMLEDVAQIRSYIDARLSLGVSLAEEDQLLNGDGVAPELAGLLTRAGLGAAIAKDAEENNADAIFRQMMALYNASYLLPDGIAINPINWSATVLLKTTDGGYIGAGPFSPIQTPTLWGLPVAATPAIVEGEAVVGAYKTGAQIFRKGGIRVEASNSHADFFIKNLVAIRAEERLALAVYRPGAFGKVTGLTGAPAAP